MEPTPQVRAAHDGGDVHADAITRAGRTASLRALTVVEYALDAPAPRRERTWLHRLTTAVDALATAIDTQIDQDDQAIGLLSEIALTHPDHADDVRRLRDEQRALRVAVASIREQLDEHPDFPIRLTHVDTALARLAHDVREHQRREAELIEATLGTDVDDHRPR